MCFRVAIYILLFLTVQWNKQTKYLKSFNETFYLKFRKEYVFPVLWCVWKHVRILLTLKLNRIQCRNIWGYSDGIFFRSSMDWSGVLERVINYFARNFVIFQVILWRWPKFQVGKRLNIIFRGIVKSQWM